MLYLVTTYQAQFTGRLAGRLKTGVMRLSVLRELGDFAYSTRSEDWC